MITQKDMDATAKRVAQMQAEKLGGAGAAAAWRDAMNALHTYAHQSDCPPGCDVVKWFSERSDAYFGAMRMAAPSSAKPAERA